MPEVIDPNFVNSEPTRANTVQANRTPAAPTNRQHSQGQGGRGQ